MRAVVSLPSGSLILFDMLTNQKTDSDSEAEGVHFLSQ